MKRQPRVLLIDDSEVSRLVCETLLVAEGYEMRTVESVDEFHQTLQQWRPDVILTDVQLPGLSGADVCLMLKADEDTARIPVVLYSSLPEDQLAVLALRCGADAFVSKAKRHEDLPRRLREICGQS